MENDVRVREFISGFYQPVEMPGGYSFNHVDTLETIELYYNSQFRNGPKDEEGLPKYFYNIVKPACDVAEKMTDLDTKDIRLIPENPDDERTLWLMQNDLKQWLKDTNFGVLLNQINHDYSKYGHVVIKQLKSGEWKKVNLTNLRVDPSAPSLDKSTAVCEVLLMTRSEIAEMKAWDETEKKMLFDRNPHENLFTVYEYYEHNIEGGKKYKRTILADILKTKSGNGFHETPESQINDKDDFLPGIILHEDERDVLPYRELKWEEVPGRWLGRGVVEYLESNQVKVNEIEILEGRALQLASLQLFQTSDDQIPDNLLTDKRPGDVIKSPTGLTQIDTQARGVGEWNNARQRWDSNTQSKTFTFDTVTGETGPSGTTLGATQIATGMATSYFNLKRENFGLFLKQLFLDDIIPSFKNQNRKEHMLKFLSSEPEIEKIYKAVAEATLRQKLFGYLRRTGLLPNLEVINMEKKKILSNIRKRKDIFFNIVENAYKDVKVKVDIVITGENMNVGAVTNSLQVFMNIIGSNPNILRDRPSRTALFKALALVGMSPVDLNLIEEQVEEEDPLAQAFGRQPQQQEAPAPNIPSPSQAPLAAPPKQQGFEQVASSSAL